MSRQQNIGCTQCKEYLDVDKLCPDDRYGYEFYHGYYETDIEHILPTIDNIKNGFIADKPEHYFHGIIKLLMKFLEQHPGHPLLILKGGSTMPWEGDSDWYDWKEMALEESVRRDDTELPRNIIEDLGIHNWQEALVHYRENCIFVDNPEEIKEPFLKHLEDYKTKKSQKET